jgi:hypothetical protein
LLLNLVITSGEAVVPLSVRSAQVAPPSVEYWYLVIAVPELEPAVNATESDEDDGVMPVIVGAAGWISEVVIEDAPVAVPAMLLNARIFTW